MKQILLLMLILAVSGLIPFQAAQAESANRLSLIESPSSAAASQQVLVLLQGHVNTPSQGFNMVLNYDPACLQLVKHAPTGLLPADAFQAERASAGTLDVTYTLLGGEKTFRGVGPLLEIEFKTLASCQTQLNLVTAKLIAPDAQGLAYYVDTELGEPLDVTINVSAPNPAILPNHEELATVPIPEAEKNLFSAPTWLAAGLALLTLFAASGLVILGLRSKLFHRPLAMQTTAAPIIRAATPVSTKPITRRNLIPDRIELRDSPFNIGNEADNQLCLPSALVSRSHAQLVRIDTNWQIVDNNSRTGTYLNEKRILQPHLLRPGDQIRIGTQLVMRFGYDKNKRVYLLHCPRELK